MTSDYVWFAAALTLALVVTAFFKMYNDLVRIGNHCVESWANVETELQRRHDLIPRLVAVVKGYAEHERGLIQEITRLREECVAARGSMRERSSLESRLDEGVRRLTARVEAYPELQADQHFLQLQEELVITEDRLQAARRFYNGNVRDNNNLIRTVPSNIIAGLCRFAEREFFEMESAAPAVPDVALD